MSCCINVAIGVSIIILDKIMSLKFPLRWLYTWYLTHWAQWWLCYLAPLWPSSVSIYCTWHHLFLLQLSLTWLAWLPCFLWWKLGRGSASIAAAFWRRAPLRAVWALLGGFGASWWAFGPRTFGYLVLLCGLVGMMQLLLYIRWIWAKQSTYVTYIRPWVSLPSIRISVSKGKFTWHHTTILTL